MELSSILKTIGDGVGSVTQQIIVFIGKLGVDVTPNISKIISALVFLGSGYLILKIMEKPVKWAIIALLVILLTSIVYSLIG